MAGKMKEVEASEEPIEEVPEENNLRNKVIGAIAGLEIRISLDQLMGLREAKLTDEEGNTHDISRKTLERYHERNYLISQYSHYYGARPEFKAAKQNWKYFSN